MGTPRAAIPNDHAQWMRNVTKQLKDLTSAALTRDQMTLHDGTFTMDGGQLNIIGGQLNLQDGSDVSMTGGSFTVSGGDWTFADGSTVAMTGGTFTITGGKVAMQATDGTDMFSLEFAGGAFQKPDGSPQPVVTMQRDDGTLVFQIGDPEPDEDGYQQLWSLFDHDGNRAVAEDIVSGFGLAVPNIPVPMYKAQALEFSKMSGTTFVVQWYGDIRVASPNLDVSIWGWADTAGGTGHAKLLVNGVQVGSTQNFDNSGVTVQSWTADLTGLTLGEIYSVQIQGRITGGGNFYMAPRSVIQRGS